MTDDKNFSGRGVIEGGLVSLGGAARKRGEDNERVVFMAVAPLLSATRSSFLLVSWRPWIFMYETDEFGHGHRRAQSPTTTAATVTNAPTRPGSSSAMAATAPGSESGAPFDPSSLSKRSTSRRRASREWSPPRQDSEN